jgi:TRAP-type C4-dicarboxylate transport system permease small subunit
MTWLTFIGASMLERQRDHIRVTIVIDALSARGRAIADICADVLIVVYLVLVLASSIETLKADIDSTMISLPVSMVLVSMSSSLGCIGILVRILTRMTRETRAILAH